MKALAITVVWRNARASHCKPSHLPLAVILLTAKNLTLFQ